nr:MAG TPA: hypothetical protein [Caudoviricetes sp.]
MKTEQEQIKEIKQIIDERVETNLGQVQGRHDNVIKTVDTVIIARDIVNAGYGDVSAYKAEIERLKEEASDNRKGTAKEILQTLYDTCYGINDETGESMGNFVSDDDILCLAKHYGVEVDV